MKAFIRGMSALVVVAGMVGFAGCGPDNESEGQKLSTKIGDAGKPAEGSIPKAKVTPPRTNDERGKAGPSGPGSQMKGSSYPGAK